MSIFQHYTIHLIEVKVREKRLKAAWKVKRADVYLPPECVEI